MFVEKGHDRNHLYSIIRQNKLEAPKSENTDSDIVKLPWIPIIGSKIRKELQNLELPKTKKSCQKHLQNCTTYTNVK